MIAYYVTYNDFIQLFQISNLTIHDWYRVLIIELVLWSSLCINPNVFFLKVVSKYIFKVQYPQYNKIDTSSVDYITAIKHGIHIKTAQCIIKNIPK